MKRFTTIFATMMLCIGLSTGFTSCSDNEEDQPAAPAAKSIEGAYHGDMTCSVMGSESTFEDMTFTLAAKDDATVSLTMSSFGEPPMQVPEITIPDIKVSGENGTYTLATTNFDTESNGKKISGVVQGTFADNTLDVKINLQYGNMPMPLICSFTATKK